MCILKIIEFLGKLEKMANFKSDWIKKKQFEKFKVNEKLKYFSKKLNANISQTWL